ncbi:MAG: sulfatase-like hydrolase/transferase [Lachnospiraceae bacterium]|nr:sulfatase-like hydrolase/transferase [Lachnospiraceae bacterium]MBQ8549376.1 sulfatase-like hydrolase/transferase [Lachnospiraceae bacterium]MBQ8846017.1 sulfatase-like hydrolase/transferase [Lachnospiraceae bacterium]
MNTSALKNYINKLLQQLRLFASECLVPALLINLCIEGFSRESLIRPLFYPFQAPLVFLYNTLLICTTLSVSFFFKKRKFVRYFILTLWLAVGITDFVLLQFRTTPFTAVDLLLLDSAFSIMGHYLTPFQIVLVVLAILLAVGIGIYLFLRAKKETTGTSRIYAGLVFGLFLLVSICSTKLFVSCGVLERNFGNLAQSFHINGLPYCFFSSVFGTGISKPVSYSEDEIDRIMSSITNSPAPQPTLSPDIVTPTVTTPPKQDDTPAATATPVPEFTEPVDTAYPNFIFLQLESFFDPTHIKGATFSADPVPTFRNLKETCSSGFLSVPSIGAGTANTEFELLTGINLDFFGPGEYPYKTVLKDTPCESIAYNLSSLGLTAHALHNNDGTFYERHKVFSRLGFDTFTPIEYMGTYYTTPLGWAKDDILLPNILSALNSTDGQDFIYTISVQGHGSYPKEELLTNPKITVDALPEELKENYYEILYFVNQLYEMDRFLYRLTEALEGYEEEVVLVLYGDHLPTFPFTDDLLTNGNIYETEYVIWTNRPSGETEKKDLEAYALSSYVLDLYDIHEGLFTRFHQTQAGSDTYQEDMKLLAYDVLYGSYESYEGILPFQPTDLQFGIVPISIRTVLFQNNLKDYYCLFINGENFTPYSMAYINDEPCVTTYINPQLISVTGFEPSEELIIRVAQVGNDSYPLSYTEPFTVTVSMEDYPQD